MTEEKKMQQKEIDLMVLFRKLYSNRKKIPKIRNYHPIHD